MKKQSVIKSSAKSSTSTAVVKLSGYELMAAKWNKESAELLEKISWVRGAQVQGITFGVGYVDNKLVSVYVRDNNEAECSPITAGQAAREMREMLVVERLSLVDSMLLDDDGWNSWLMVVANELE